MRQRVFLLLFCISKCLPLFSHDFYDEDVIGLRIVDGDDEDDDDSVFADDTPEPVTAEESVCGFPFFHPERKTEWY